MLDYHRNCLFQLSAKLCLFFFVMLSSFASAQDQIISLDISNPEILDGESTTLTVSYTTTGEVQTTGLGLRLHFDSSALSCDQSPVSYLLAESNIGFQLLDDSDNFDADDSTDKYFNSAWVNVTGAWPFSATLPMSLFSVDCTALGDFNGTTLKFSYSSVASGFNFVAAEASISRRVLPIDTTPPVITLLGDQSLVLYIGDTYVEAGATADGGETVLQSGSVDTSVAGTYTLTYTATDEAGNEAEAVIRTVMVLGIVDPNDGGADGGGTDGTDGSGNTDPVMDTDKDGIPDSVEIETGRDPYAVDYMVAVGDKFSCALDGSGVSCWGDSADGKLNVPDLLNPTYVAVGFDHACAIDDTGVVCWGKDQYKKTQPPELSNPTKVSLGRLNSCAIDDTGVICWGLNTSNRSTPPPLSNPTDIDLGSDHACAIDDTGLVCWGKFSFKRGQLPTNLVNPTQVSAGWYHSCVLDDNGVSCWGSKAKTGSNAPPVLNNPIVVETGTTFSCAIDDDGVKCWGANGQKQLSRIPELSNPTQLSLGTDHACAVDATGIVCWGSTGRGKSSVPTLNIVKDNDGDGIEDWEEDVLGTNKYAADSDGDGVNDNSDEMPLNAEETLDSDRDGIGNNADTDDDNDGISDALEALTGRDSTVEEYVTGVGAKFSCAMDDNGVTCWGDDADGKLDVPTLVNPRQLEVGAEHACVIDDTGVVCWGKNVNGNTVVPALSNPTTVSAGTYHTCAIDDTGIVCWGDTSHKIMTRMPEFEYPTEVSVGFEHACAIDATGVVCWGKKSNKRGQVPNDLVNPRGISSGFLHSCVLDDNGVSCWGSRAATGTITSPELSNPVQVEAGKTFSCALDDNGITCWGQNARKQRIVPNLVNPTHFSLGNDHACANDASGVVCWGGNSGGKRTVASTLSLVLDNDGDGVNDVEDVWPTDPSEAIDTDGDGIGNNADTDDDGDGVADASDAFPLDNSEAVDTDLDGIGNNADTDDDGDGVADVFDAFPLDSSETTDADNDGLGDNAFPPNADTTTFTVYAPGATTVSMHSSAFDWDLNHPDGASVDNGDGTWTVTISPSWTSQADYKWIVDGVEEDFSSEFRAGQCDLSAFAGYSDTWFNRIWNSSRGNISDDVAGTCVSADTTPTPLVMTVRAESASSVRMTGPWWSWNPVGGPVAANNGDGTWSVTLDPAPTENMEYLWVVDGAQENLIDSAINGECSVEINSATLLTDYSSYATRQWFSYSGDISDTVYNGCSGSDVGEPEPTVVANVLVDGIVDNGWDIGVSAFDSGQDYQSCYDDNGAGCPNISWQTATDSSRGDVLQITHAASGIFTGLYFPSSAPRNLSAAASGNIVFDIKSISGDSNFVVKVDCVYPCASAELQLGSRGATDWETVTVPVSQLTGSGLDITNVSNGLVIWPVSQANAVYQLDNIRWEVTEDDSVNTDPTPTSYPGYSLAWSDEFNGTQVNESDWTFEIGRGNNGWGNNESQYYRKQNASVANGLLTITAKQESYSSASYTSTRMKTQGKRSFRYGRIDVRAKLPQGQGIWPAIWMLGENITSVGWPSCGEIDIMEMIGGSGRENTTHGTIHFSNGSGNHQYVGDSTTLGSGTLADAFHTYSIEWDSSSIKWFLDGVQFASQQITTSDRTEFHNEFFILLNVAVGGNWPGYPDGSTQFPQQMQVDYVRVYQPTISGFSFLKSDNPSLAGDINLSLEDGVLSGRTAAGDTVNNLVASFQHGGQSVLTGGVEQVSGNTVNDFSGPLNYTVVGSDGVATNLEVDLTQFTGLPIVNITTDGGVAIDSKDNYVTGTVSIDGGREFSDFPEAIMEIRGRGNSTWMHAKKPFQMKFDSKLEFLDMPKDRKWIFLAEYSDKTILRNRIAFEMGYISNLDWTPASVFAEVFINDQYNGTYNITQKVEETNRRVAIGDTGYLLEIDHPSRLDAEDVFFYSDHFLLNIKEPNLVQGDAAYTYIDQLINQFENVLFGDNFTDPVIGYAAYIDLDSFIDWYLISEITKNVDSVNFSSIYMNVIPGEKIKMGPLWDFDLAFGNVDYADSRYVEGFWIKNNA